MIIDVVCSEGWGKYHLSNHTGQVLTSQTLCSPIWIVLLLSPNQETDQVEKLLQNRRLPIEMSVRHVIL